MVTKEAMLLNFGISIGVAISIFLSWALVRHLRLRPSNERFWVNDNARMATAEFDGEKVTIRNVRDFEWRSTKDFDERWIDVTMSLDKMAKIWFVLEYFEPSKKQMAHTIMVFEDDDGQRIACSIEVRGGARGAVPPYQGAIPPVRADLRLGNGKGRDRS